MPNSALPATPTAFSDVHKSSLAAPRLDRGAGAGLLRVPVRQGGPCGGGHRPEGGGERPGGTGSPSPSTPPISSIWPTRTRTALQKTIGYITAACLVASQMGAARVVIHSGALMKRTRREALDTALPLPEGGDPACDDQGFGHIALCPETMGKINQLGDLDEVLELCTLDERLIPCIDFGHLYARSLGADDGAEAFGRMLDRVESVLGPDRAARFHSHFSHIEFTPDGGEKCHRTFADDGGYGPDWAPLAAEVARRGWSPTFICESAGTQAEDALEMKKIYQAQLREP